MSKKILVVHPYDKSTTFLNRIKNHIKENFPEHLHYFSVKPNEASHQQCLKIIQKFSNDGLIFFMGHGKSNCLYGARGDYYGTLKNVDLEAQEPEKYYYQDNYINERNIKIFDKKKVIALACNSNAQLGKKSIENGAKVFMGFGNLPTSNEELEEQGEENKPGVSLNKITQALKTEINYIIKRSIEIGVQKKYTFSELVELIYFITNQKISYYLVDQKKSERKLIANYLYSFKKEIKLYGNGNEKLLI